MNECFADIGGGITLCYEETGSRGDVPLLLIMGLGTQMLGWPDEFVERLAGEGFHVVRFDNRDVGRSTVLRHARPPRTRELLLRRPRHPAYTLDQMAADAAALLDHLGLESAHVIGASMGGMIAQQLAARHPERVRSLTSIMSTTGGRRVGQPHFSLLTTFLRRAPRERDAFAEYMAGLFAKIGSPDAAEVEHVKELARRSFDRGHHPGGYLRQLGAILASGDRTEQLRSITAPTLVIHGERDRLVSASGGRATAAAIPGARLMTVPGMGHDLPRARWDDLLGAITQHVRAAEGAAAKAA